MGYSLKEAHAMTFEEFYFVGYGFEKRQQNELYNTRKLIATIVNWAGKTAENPIDEKSIFTLPFIDRQTKKPVVKSREEAEAIFKTFLQ